jgi:aldose 1-epimerase
MAEGPSIWGVVDGQPARRYTLGDPAAGLRISLSDFGASLLTCEMPDGKGGLVDVVLGCDDPKQVLEAGCYFGATVGRYGNRIRRGHFSLDGHNHELERNEGANHLHGGFGAYDRRFWSVALQGPNAISFGLVSADGDGGYPGTLVAQSRYSVSGNTLTYELLATVDKASPVNLLNHAYWNLGDGGDVLDHFYQFDAEFYTPADSVELMLTGAIELVRGTPFDFLTPQPARARFQQIANSGAGRIDGGFGGYDHNLVLDGYGNGLRRVGKIVDRASGRFVEIATTEPGIHFYTGGYLGGVPRKGGGTYGAFAGFTLETQKFPDSPNIRHFPSATLRPGELYRHVTSLTFGLQ